MTQVVKQGYWIEYGYIESGSGFIPPKMTQSQRDAIADPAVGLLIYQTNATPGYYYYTGSSWQSIGSGGGGGGSSFDVLATFLNNTNSTVNANSTAYTSLSSGAFNATLASRVVIFPNSGYLKNFFILASGLQPASGSIVITFMKGSNTASIANTALSVTIPLSTDAGAGTIYSDTENSISVSAGDFAVISNVNNASATSLNIISISATYTNQP